MSALLIVPEDQLFGDDAVRDRAKAAFVVQLVALATGVPATEIARSTRAPQGVARARWLAMYLLNVALSVPLMRVAAVFGRDRTTVSHAVNRTEDSRSDADFDAAVSALERCAMAAPADLSFDTLNPSQTGVGR